MSGSGEIDLASLSVEQLNGLKKQLETKIDSVQYQYNNLKHAQEGFLSSKTVLTGFSESDEGSEVMVPLTDALFVPGTLASGSKVLVELGTGYYVDKTLEEAKDFMQRKADYIKTNSEALVKIINGERNNLQAVVSMLQQRVKEAAES